MAYSLVLIHFLSIKLAEVCTLRMLFSIHISNVHTSLLWPCLYFIVCTIILLSVISCLTFVPDILESSLKLKGRCFFNMHFITIFITFNSQFYCHKASQQHNQAIKRRILVLQRTVLMVIPISSGEMGTVCILVVIPMNRKLGGRSISVPNTKFGI